MESELVLDLDELAQYLAEKCGCTVEDADMYLYGEEEYLDCPITHGYRNVDFETKRPRIK